MSYEVERGAILDNVVECLEMGANATRGSVLDLRGEALPFIRLRDFFGFDRLAGEFQTVIKPLGSLFRHRATPEWAQRVSSGFEDQPFSWFILAVSSSNLR